MSSALADRSTPALADCSTPALEDELATLAAHIQAATARLLALLAELDRREAWASSGALSCAHWLAWRTGLDLGAAREHVRVARALTALPTGRAAFECGELSYSKVRAVTRIARPETEADLLAMARQGTAARLERLVRAYRRADPAAENMQARAQQEARSLHTRWTEDGMLVVEGRLTPEQGALLQRALAVVMEEQLRDRGAAARPRDGGAAARLRNGGAAARPRDGGAAERPRDGGAAERRRDGGTAPDGVAERLPGLAARQADALAAVADRALGASAPRTGGDRVQEVVHVDAEVLADPAADGRSALEDGPGVSAETSRRLACDCSVVEVRHGPGDALAAGRKSRVISAPLRRALRARDGGCVFPGCTNRRCDGHHLRHWAAGGPAAAPRPDGSPPVGAAGGTARRAGGLGGGARGDRDGAPTPRRCAARRARAPPLYNGGMPRRRIVAAVIASLATVALLGCDGAGAAADVPRLRDDAGRVLVYRGVNFSGAAKAPPELTAPLGDDDLDRLVAWGVTLVRYLVFWEAIEPTPGARDEAYLDRVEAQIRRLTARGIDVFVDFHQDLFGRGFGSAGLPRFACTEELYATYVPRDPWYLNYGTPEVAGCFDYFFTHPELHDAFGAAAATVAARLADDPRVIGFDLMNEPYFGSAGMSEFEPERLWPFYQTAAASLRAAAPATLLFLEPSAARNLGFPTALPPFGPGEVYAPHYYPQATETGAYDGDPTWIRAELAGLADDAARLGAPWILGEAGIISDHDRAGDFMRDLLDALDAHFASVTVWDYARGSGWALLDADGGEHVTAQAFVRPYAHRVAGRPEAMSYDPPSGRFAVSWAETGVAAPTAIVLPLRLYPQPRVTVGDPRDTFVHDAAAGRLLVTGHPAVTRHEVVVAPGP